VSKVLSVRVSDEVAQRVEEIAAAQGAKASAWLKEAVVSYLDDHGRGLPDRPAVARSVAPSEPVRVSEEEYEPTRRRLMELRAQAAGHAQRAREERDRRHAERGW
jgi:hypothetical protein